MDLISAAYNKLEVLAVAADRVLNAAVDCCETWLAGRGTGPHASRGDVRRGVDAAARRKDGHPDQPVSA